ncbi:MAG: NADP-dependent oxidoreductase [Steroidobacteraceae bacterium]
MTAMMKDAGVKRMRWLGVAGAVAVATAVSAAIPAKMQAIRNDAATSTMTLQTVDVPTPKEGQILIQAYAASANPSDWGGNPGNAAGMAAGAAPGGAPAGAAPGGAGGPPGGAPQGAGGPPGGEGMGGAPGGAPGGAGMGGGMANRAPGNDVSGVVAAVGPGVTEFKVGDSVVAALQQSGGGAYAEYAVANVDTTVLKPKNFTYEQAAGIPTAGFTGLRMVIIGNVKKGDRVLVIGAAGGVGSTAVQAAKARGATVISSAKATHEKYLKSIGVDEIISYDKEDVAAKAKNIDVTIVTVGSENANGIGYTKNGGRVVTIAGAADAAACSAKSLTCSSGGPNGSTVTIKELLTELKQLAEANKFTVKVDKVFPLAQTNAALAFGREGSREGKLAISITKDSAKK